MLRLLVVRLLQSLLVLFLVYTATFWLLMAIPGDPFVGEKKVPPSVTAALRARYGLVDENPATGQPYTHFEKAAYAYVGYAKSILNKHDFGPTIQYENFTVNDVIATGLPVSVALGSLALVIALAFGVAAGTFSAVKKGRGLDVVLTTLTLLGVSVPTFVIGTLVLMTLAIVVPIFPSGGWGELKNLVLPALTLSAFYMAYITRLTRVSVIDTLSSDYVRTARAKGLSYRRVVSTHVLRNAALPVLSFLGPSAAAVLTGSFVVEKIFSVPGLGSHFVNACLNRDLPLVLGTVMTYTAIVVAFNLLVDVAYAYADPRIG